MMTIRLAWGLLALLLLTGGCVSSPPPAPDDPAPELDRLEEWLTGRFETRAARGAAVWHMTAVPILVEDTDSWILVTQWRDSSDEPDRVFVYRLVASGPRNMALDMYTVTPLPDRAAGSGSPTLPVIDRENLKRRNGCRIHLSPDGLSYVGGTRGRDCPASYRGAVRLRIELTVREREIREWLQGFDADGDRLWSAEDVGRIYRRTGQP